jgi:hypothetical protein
VLIGAGDGLQPQDVVPVDGEPRGWRRLVRVLRVSGSRSMSHVAIAAGLALEDVSSGERLAAFSLASFANREHRAWPGTPIAAARAGLSRSQYLAARESLRNRGLITIEDSGGGRGNSPTIALTFARTGPWIDREINAPLFEAVLGYSARRGSARLLLATLAALADKAGAVRDLATDELRVAAGMADSTYRRARAVVLREGDVTLATPGGGRARTNQWMVDDPRVSNAEPAMAPRTRVTPSQGVRPLLATVHTVGGDLATDALLAADRLVKGPGLSGVSGPNPGQDRTVSGRKGPSLSGVSGLNAAQDRTVSRKTPPETPPANARAGWEPRNPRTIPPRPPDGGSRDGLVQIVEDYTSDRGRRRQRTVLIDPDEIRQLRSPGDADQVDWQLIRDELRGAVGESVFAIWLEPLRLRAIDQGGALVVSGPHATRRWAHARFGGALDRAGDALGRQARLADDRELQLLDAISPSSPGAEGASVRPPQTSHDHKEAV